MYNQITKEALGERLICIISYALRLDPDRITPESRIVIDLKAESLDILDIRFSIEQEFGFKIAEHEIMNTIGNGLSSMEFLEKLTVSSLTEFVGDKLKTREQAQC
jgi:acyl carrier protein